jgi:uncharacterized protein YlxW (UPF0749 family)
VTRAAAAVTTLQENIVSLDKRVNDLSSRVTDLHNQSDAADGEMRARLAVLDALAKYAAERAMQPNLPPPFQPSQGSRR